MNFIKKNIIKLAIIFGVVIISLIIIIAVSSSSSSSSSNGSKENETKKEETKSIEEKVEEILTELPKKEKMNYNQFLSNITYYSDKYQLDDDGQAWFAFKWISQHIVYDTGTKKDPQGVYEDGKTVCHGYSRLFIAMVQAMGFPAENTQRVMGSVKSNFHCTGESDIGLVHEWTALKIKGKWELYDVRKGTGSGSGTSFKYAFNPYYYKTPAIQLIRDHYPDESQFQFLDPPLTVEQYCDMGVMYNRMFTFGFTGFEPDKYFLNTTNPIGTLKFYFKPEKPTSFKIEFISGGYVRKNNVVTKKSNYYEVKYNLTDAGQYYVHFLGNDTENSSKFSDGGYFYLNYAKK